MIQNLPTRNKTLGVTKQTLKDLGASPLQESEKILRDMLVTLSRLSTIEDLPFENRLEAMRTAIKDDVPSMKLRPLFDDINTYMSQHQQVRPPLTQQASADEHLSLSALLLEKLDAISSPKEFVEQLEPTKELLRLDVDKKHNASFAIALQAFFDEWQQFTQNLHSENRDMQGFLKTLTDELHHIRENINGDSPPADKQKKDAQIDLDVSLEHLQDELGETSKSESALHELQQLIFSRIKHIRQGVQEYKQQQQQSEALIASLYDKIEQMEQKTSRLENRLKEKDRQYLTDSLTKIPNRIAYEERIQQECERNIRNGTPVCLLVCDIDNFKSINDTYGHASGDKVLRAIAELLKQNIRNIDFVARFGGEEFVIIMNGIGLENGMLVADKLRRKIEMATFMVKNVKLNVTLSGGVAEFREYDSPASLFERADNALYIAKECGKNRIESE